MPDAWHVFLCVVSVIPLSCAIKAQSEASVHSQFRCLQIQVWDQSWPLKHYHRVVLKSLFWYLGSVFRVVVLLEHEPSTQSEVNSTLEDIFIKGND